MLLLPLLLQRPQRHLKNFIMFAAREAEFLFLLPTFSCVGVCRCMCVRWTVLVFISARRAFRFWSE